MYAEQEELKTFVKFTGWKCPYCNKVCVASCIQLASLPSSLSLWQPENSVDTADTHRFLPFCTPLQLFVSEHYLDRHLDARHAHITAAAASAAGATRCLADLCVVFGCTAAVAATEPLLRSTTAAAASTPHPAHSAVAAVAKIPCTAATLPPRRRHCRALMTQCFPPNTAPALHSMFAGSYCDGMTCDGAGRLQLPTAAQLLRSRHGKGAQSGGFIGIRPWTIVTIVIMIALVVYYTALWLLRSELTVGDDLRSHGRGVAGRRRQRHQRHWWSNGAKAD